MVIVNSIGDIDIDFGDRSKILSLIDHTPAAMRNVSPIKRHNSGVYVTQIPYDPIYKMATLDYTDAEKLGYLKIDFLNVYVYQYIKNETHLVEMMGEPDWGKLYDREFCNKLIHISEHYDTLIAFPEAVDSIPKLAMFISAIRPAKRHLIGKTWTAVNEDIWTKPVDGGYYFKKSHSLSYAHLIVVHMNLLSEHFEMHGNYDLRQLSD